MNPTPSLAADFTAINKFMASAYNKVVKTIAKEQQQEYSAAERFEMNLYSVARMVDAELRELMPKWLHDFLVRRRSNSLFQLSNFITGIKVVESLESKTVKIFKRGQLIKTFYLGKDIIVS